MGLLFRAIGPKQKGEVLSRLGRIRVQKQVSQQRLLPGWPDMNRAMVRIDEPKIAQKLNLHLLSSHQTASCLVENSGVIIAYLDRIIKLNCTLISP
jgi:hypothetical protein